MFGKVIKEKEFNKFIQKNPHIQTYIDNQYKGNTKQCFQDFTKVADITRISFEESTLNVTIPATLTILIGGLSISAIATSLITVPLGLMSLSVAGKLIGLHLAALTTSTGLSHMAMRLHEHPYLKQKKCDEFNKLSKIAKRNEKTLLQNRKRSKPKEL